MGLIFVLSSQSGLRVSEDPDLDRPLRSAAHVITYATLGGLILYALTGFGRVTLTGVLTAFAIAVVYGASDEVHQAFVPERSGQLADVAMDALGAAAGVAIASLVLRRRWLGGS